MAPRQNNEIVGPDLERWRVGQSFRPCRTDLFSLPITEIAQQQISGFSFYAHGAITRGTFGKQGVDESVLPDRYPLPLLNEPVPNNLPPRPELHEHRAELSI